MGTWHHVARHVQPSCGPILLGGSVGYTHSFNQSLFSCTKVYHAGADPGVQHTMLLNTPSLEDAFALLEQSLELPSVESLTCVLQNCLEKKKLANVWRFYKHILANGLDTSSLFEDHLVPMFVECGSASDAQ
eukprot:c11507_g1_i1 orf=2-394(-)